MSDKNQRFEQYNCSQGCPVEAALELIGGKWKGVILYHLMEGTQRFGELKKQVGTVTQRMLTKQLRELEIDGLVSRKVFAVVPPHVEYSLTPKGETLRPIITALRDWGVDHAVREKEEV
ncbi:transcriptional regulator, HxlR family [Pseudovibrio ascidiaceicola]|uniref:Transcriptional regulator, HxlR family n=1 Tax=Pseudovibrio ascidiaceicola TaxID=285279 RepID=A0A1I4DF39_9HYPH|nr:helix-turn-helix domain-containing protein [Pseudovibrio ascidiaceicola]SFK92258.1 transcriptional regulator, HxlR family [Pseudovibrio ascidiaceicola]